MEKVVIKSPQNGFEERVNLLYNLGCEKEEYHLQELSSDWDANPLNMIWDYVFNYHDHKEAWKFIEEAITTVGYPPVTLMFLYEEAKYSIEKLVSDGQYLCLETTHKLGDGFEDRKHVIWRSKNALSHINRLAKIIHQPELSITL